MPPPRSHRPRPRGKSRDVPFLDPVRLAVAAMDRIRSVAKKSGRIERMGLPISAEARAEVLALEPSIPPSYLAALAEHATVGGSEIFYGPDAIRAAMRDLPRRGADAARYFPFGELHGGIVSFDRVPREDSQAAPPGEWAVVALHPSGRVDPISETFAHWLDSIADEREEQIAFALSLPDPLLRVLTDLGFRPNVERIRYLLDSSDEEALTMLLGARAMREASGTSGRLYDATGKAHLVLDAYDFSLTVTLRVGERVFQADEVFRWLRSFRDEDLLGRHDANAAPSHIDRVRDLRKAEPEAATAIRGTFAMHALPAPDREFVSGAGGSADMFWVAARAREGYSLLYTVEKGTLRRAQRSPHTIHRLHMTQHGELWASGDTHAIRFAGGSAKAYLIRSAESSAPRGIVGDQPIIWGSDFVAGFDGDRFGPFEPQPQLTPPDEQVRGVVTRGHEVFMLVCGELVGAVAWFDGTRWVPIEEAQMIDGDLVALDSDDHARYVLVADGQVLRVEIGMARAIPLPFGSEAFVTDARERRPLFDVKITAWGVVFATAGGIICCRDDDTTFYEAPNCDATARLERLGNEADSPLLACVGPHLWVWDGGVPTIVDTRKW